MHERAVEQPEISFCSNPTDPQQHKPVLASLIQGRLRDVYLKHCMLQVEVDTLQVEVDALQVVVDTPQVEVDALQSDWLAVNSNFWVRTHFLSEEVCVIVCKYVIATVVVC